MSSLKGADAERQSDTAELLRKDSSYLAHLVEDMLHEMGVSHYDSRTTHLLVDILQRESFVLLKDAHDQSDMRVSREKQRLLQDSISSTILPKLNVRVSEEDAQVACQQYISRNVARSSFLQDINDMQRYSNSVRLGVKSIAMPPSKQNRGYMATLKLNEPNSLGFYPTGVPPHLPENIALNTLLPNWDVELSEDES